MKRLEDIFQATPPDSVEGDGVRLEVTGAIEWDGVSFSYFAGNDGNAAARPWALRNIRVKVPAGSKLAIVGRTGSGKSTMVKLLARLIEPTAGRVLLDGRDVRELPLGSLRKTIGVVPQEPILFSDTMARNISFGRGDASLNEIEMSARTAGLEGDVAVLPHCLHTVVGEPGISLSGGQKQRVTIARLLTTNPASFGRADARSTCPTQHDDPRLHNLTASAKDRTTIGVA